MTDSQEKKEATYNQRSTGLSLTVFSDRSDHREVRISPIRLELNQHKTNIFIQQNFLVSESGARSLL